MKQEEIHDEKMLKSDSQSINANKNLLMKNTLEDISEGAQSFEENDN